ncbi:voltage-dependent calcium channel beta subunit-associated regulatory protein isoform X1 [Myxocyprinus asiaticus]|uniref:voltage-dependent calcium channel beta subunit-associated regulatory protein isoform X1 n=1 Tax=Myxocyprinus asiaticus TaxID=70543 RepID=UPI002221C8BA|nr:voltage-dependent calcium channel beta subunit-associated regulatory protein isoform X1 [Myxocyprinus asiaticus]
MSNESAVWTNLTEHPTDVPLSSGTQNGYVLLLVLLSIFVGGTLVLLSILLILCRRCCEGDRHHAWFILCLRASDDAEKSNTTYIEEAQPVHEITIRIDESDCLSAASSHDMETERFLSTGTTGRRVSFNEAALFDHSKKTQEKGRRYTLTEGDFHHLKNARLTHLHIPSPALQILTIHECESSQNSIAMTMRPVAKSSLSIFQPPVCSLPQTALTSRTLSSSSALPGDTLNSIVDTTFCESIAVPGPEPTSPCLMEVRGGVARNAGIIGNGRDRTSASATALSSFGGAPQAPMLQFFTKLRRHASLEGASPYFKIKKWKFDSSQRASSLDMRGSPKRRQFQRQRAASESMDQEEHDAHHIDLIQYIARTKDVTYCPTRPSPRLLSPPSTPPPSLGRLEVEVMVEPSCSRASGQGVIGLPSKPSSEESLGMGCCQESLEPQTLYRDIWTLRASLERYVSSDQSSNNDKDSVRSDADSVCSLVGRMEMGGLPRYPSQDIGDEMEGDADLPVDEGLEKGCKQDSVDSERGSDGESGTRKLLQMDSGYASIEAPSRAPEELRLFGSSSSSKDGSAVERRHFFSSGRKGTVCESFDTDIFDEELEEEHGSVDGVKTDESTILWSPYGQMFTQRDAKPHPPKLSRRDYSIDEKTDALFHEFLRHDPQFDQQESPLRSKHRSRVHLRKQWQRSKQYSDPGQRFQSSFDRYRTPLRRGETVNYPLETSYHSTLPRIISAPDEESSEGATSTPDTPKADQDTTSQDTATDMDSVSAKDTKISSNTDSSGTVNEKEVLEASLPPPMTDTVGEQSVGQENSRKAQLPPEPPDECMPEQLAETSYGPQTITEELSDKLAATLKERLYSDLRRTREQPECSAVTVTYTSPDHHPV